MKIDELIDEYKKQVAICAAVDYNDMSTVKANNSAVDRMYQIMDELAIINGSITKFSELLDDEKDRINVWAAVHLLEKLSPDERLEQKALKIVENEQKDNLGFQYWLKDYYEKKKNKN